jgi:hypothetical protein
MEKAIKELFAEDVVSIEPVGAPAHKVRGLANVIKKGRQFVTARATTCL